MKKILWLDTETTGLNPKIHGLREFAFIIEIDGIEVEKGPYGKWKKWRKQPEEEIYQPDYESCKL